MAATSENATSEQTGLKDDDKTASSTPLLRASESQIFARSPVVKLIVGPAQTEYHVHKEMLCSESRFFRACFTSGFAETTSSKVDMPEDSTKEVEPFMQWLYAGGPNYTRGQGHCANLAATAYAFATKIGAYAYCNAIMDAVIDFIKASKIQFNIDGLWVQYEAGLRDTQIGRFALKSTVHRLMTCEDKDNARLNRLSEQVKNPAMSPDVTTDVLLAVLDYRKSAWTNPVTWEKSHFHVAPEAA